MRHITAPFEKERRMSQRTDMRLFITLPVAFEPV